MIKKIRLRALVSDHFIIFSCHCNGIALLPISDKWNIVNNIVNKSKNLIVIHILRDCNLQLYTESPVFLFQNSMEFLEAKRVGFKEQIGCQLQKKIAWFAWYFTTSKDCDMIKTFREALFWERKGLVTSPVACFPVLRLVTNDNGWNFLVRNIVSGLLCGAWRNMNIPHVPGIWLWRHEHEPTHTR